jgi:hypothetical protein
MIIKATMVSPPSLDEIPEFESFYMDTPNEVDESSQEAPKQPETMTIEAAIKSCLHFFFFFLRNGEQVVMHDHVDLMIWGRFIKLSLALRRRIRRMRSF